MGVSVTETVPVPGVTKGGEVYGSGARSIGGNSSPSRQTGILPTVRFALVPTSGTGAASGGTTAGGGIVIRIISPVLIIKSAGICRTPLLGFIGKILHLLYQNNDTNTTARRAYTSASVNRKLAYLQMPLNLDFD